MNRMRLFLILIVVVIAAVVAMIFFKPARKAKRRPLRP